MFCVRIAYLDRRQRWLRLSAPAILNGLYSFEGAMPMSGQIAKITLVLALLACGVTSVADETRETASYAYSSIGTRLFEWGPEDNPIRVKVLLEEANLGSAGAEIIEIDFPPAYESRSHFHELEILYVIEGELEHIVDGESHVLKPGMIGIVRYPNEVVHKAHAENGARVLVFWPLGNEVKGLEGLNEKPIE
jgi:quercetin dioxygenase-like cupin family protein